MSPSSDLKIFALAATLLGGIAAAGCGRASLSKDAGRDSSAVRPDGHGDEAGDAGKDAWLDVLGADHPRDAPAETSNADGGCAADARKFCVQGTVLGDFAACDDVVTSAACVDGQWKCPFGDIDPSLCTCDGDPAANCTRCTKTGFVCDDAGVDGDATSDANTCAFSATYRFYDDGGLGEFVDTVVLTPPRSETIERHYGTADAGVCARELPCASTPDLGVAAIEDAIANPDVQAALAKPAGTLYGVDPRPSDGAVFVFQRGDGKGFMVGTGAAVPPGLAALAATLHTVDGQAFAAPECVSL
jgi:hypothetical protein